MKTFSTILMKQQLVAQQTHYLTFSRNDTQNDARESVKGTWRRFPAQCFIVDTKTYAMISVRAEKSIGPNWKRINVPPINERIWRQRKTITWVTKLCVVLVNCLTVCACVCTFKCNIHVMIHHVSKKAKRYNILLFSFNIKHFFTIILWHSSMYK